MPPVQCNKDGTVRTLDPYYDKDHRGLFIAQGKELNTLRPRTHSDTFKDMQYDERYTNRLATAGLDVISYQVRHGLPNYNIAAMTTLIDRKEGELKEGWRRLSTLGKYLISEGDLQWGNDQCPKLNVVFLVC